MRKRFFKYNGAGNDYLFFDCFHAAPKCPGELSKVLSDRHFSVGGDGIILAERSSFADAKMRIFNSDGSEGEMCGNGLRCFARFLYEVKGMKKDAFLVETRAGIRKVFLEVIGENFEMVPPDSSKCIPVLRKRGDGCDFRVTADMGDARIFCAERAFPFSDSALCISMGNPHCVVFTEDVKKLDVPALGRSISESGAFLNGVNVEFVEEKSDMLFMRVFERGSGETLACGTGACAAAVASIKRGLFERDAWIRVCLPGGTLEVKETRDTVLLRGDANFNFSGVVEVGDLFEIHRNTRDRSIRNSSK